VSKNFLRSTGAVAAVAGRGGVGRFWAFKRATTVKAEARRSAAAAAVRV
jgi:hypothetical protein